MENAPRSTQRRIPCTNTTRAAVWLMAIALVAAVVLLVSSAATAATTVEIPIDTTYPPGARSGARGEPGDLFLVGEAPAPAGAQCTAELTFGNNPGEEPSIHPDNDILVGPITFTDVENGTFQAAGLPFTSDGTNLVYVRLGADGVFSAGFLLEVTCEPRAQPITTTLPNPSTTSTSSSTTVPVTEPPPTMAPSATTITSPPPINGVDTGGGACADGACAVGAFSLSPLTTWMLLGGVLAIGGAILAWAFVRGGTRKETPTR